MTRKDEERDVKQAVSAVDGGRKPYVAPTLSEHGAVEAVTERGGSGSRDVLSNT